MDDQARTPSEELDPARIRAIRQRLGLSQVEAGELLGGGPRAFSKYESGLIVPSAATANLLRLLDAAPENLITLTGPRAIPIAKSDVRPFEVTGRHVAEIRPVQFPNLLRRLLSAEARGHDIKGVSAHVAAQIDVPDGGEDGLISWTGDPQRTRFLPARLCQFQLKAGKISRSQAGSDVIAKGGALKDRIRSVIERGGVYTMLSTHSYVGQEISKREAAIHGAITGAGVSARKDQVSFRDADQLAEWINEHPSVAVWVLEQTQPGLLGPFRSWSHWAGRAEHDNSPWTDDPRLTSLRSYVRDKVSEPHGVARLVGFSGIGKSRLALEAFVDDTDEVNSDSLAHLVLYAQVSDVGELTIKNAVQILVDSAFRAIVVVDRCELDLHDDLAAMVRRASSRLSLLTIDDEIPPGPPSPNWFKLDEAPAEVTERMIELSSPSLASEDKRRLARFSKGYPKIARLLAQSWSIETPVAHTTDQALVDSIVLGRRPREADMVRRAAMLLSVFGLLIVRPNDNAELQEIASLGRGLGVAELVAAIESLLSRGVLQRRGNSAIVQPRPIALNLAEKQWREWSPDGWDQVLAKLSFQGLNVRAAKQLAWLNTTSTAVDVVRHVCRWNGPLSTLEGISNPGNAAVLSELAEIDAATVAELLERLLSTSKAASFQGDVRRHVVWALEKIAFDPATFEEGGRLLFELATDENEKIANNATGQFKSLFPVLLGDTAADGDARLHLLDDLLQTSESQRLLVVVQALLEGAKVDFFSRSVGSESHGSKPALESWRPVTWGDAWNYVRNCVERLIPLAKREDEVGEAARNGISHNLRLYACRGDIELVEEIVRSVCNARGWYWPEALESLGHVLVYDADGLPDETLTRVRSLIALLQPRDLSDRVRYLVTEMPWDFPADEKLEYAEAAERQRDAVDKLADELASNPSFLRSVLPQLSTGDQRMAGVLGESLGRRIADPENLVGELKLALLSTPAANRNFSLLGGFLKSLQQSDSETVESFKEEASRSPDFAPALPLICWLLDIKEHDVELVKRALDLGLLPTWRLMQWTLGGVLANLPASAVSSLFQKILTRDAEGYVVALDLMGMYAHGNKVVLDELLPELRLVAENAHVLSTEQRSQMGRHHFTELMGWILKKGESDPSAREVARTLARQLVDSAEYGSREIVASLLRPMLSDFAATVWPIIGQAIVSDQRVAWRLDSFLGDSFSFGEAVDPPILSLPEETLFAWCHAYPNVAPAFVADVIPILTNKRPDADRSLHPLMMRLLNEFGERGDVLLGLTRNMNSFGWMGSRTTYYALYQEPVRSLLTHSKAPVRRWAKRTLASLEADIAQARNEDEERDAQFEV